MLLQVKYLQLLIILLSLFSWTLARHATFTSSSESLRNSSSESCGEFFDMYCSLQQDENNKTHCYNHKENDLNWLQMSPVIYKNCKICGYRKLLDRWKIIPKIYGGRESHPNSWPWVGGIYVMKNHSELIRGERQRIAKSNFVCAATLISNQYAISATHCLINDHNWPFTEEGKWNKVENTFLRLGDHHLRDWEFEGQVDVPIAEYMPYRRGDFVFHGDISIIRLSHPVEFNERIQPVCMPPPNFNLAENDKCIAVGWGRIHRNAAELASSLHEVDLRIKNMAYCKSFLIKRSLRDAQLCAYSPEKVFSSDLDCSFPGCRTVKPDLAKEIGIEDTKTQTCINGNQPGRHTFFAGMIAVITKGLLDGDTGGGLFCKLHEDDEQWYLFGVASYPLFPPAAYLFSSVTWHIEWIHDNVK